MDENNASDVNDSEKSKPVEKSGQAGTKKRKKDKDAGDSPTTKVKSYLLDIYGEFNKVIWPSKDALTKQTTTVIIASVVIGLIIAAFDYIFAQGYGLLMRLVS